jgi:two-component system cell cycle sensor histidine kinase PleC
MAPRSTNSTDKIIVDRRKAHQSTEVARAVRRTREKLAQRDGSPAFDREILQLHARAILQSGIAYAMFLLFIAVAGITLDAGRSLLIWSALAAIGFAALTLLALHVERTNVADIKPDQIRPVFFVAHAIAGLAWTYFAYATCDACDPEQFPVVKAIVLLIAMAVSALITSQLTGALLVTFIGVIPAYILAVGWQASPIESIMTMLLILSLAFFAYIAIRMNRSATMLLSFRTEKDGLIAELETAKSMSDEARRRAEEANLAKSRFLASMSHELRTPLNAILGFSEVMANEVLGPMGSPTYREYSRDIHDSGKHLLDLINEILDLSRIEAGRYQLNEEPMHLVDTLEECCHLMELRARAKEIRISQHFEADLPRLFADERAVRQVALNLLSNAVKFTPSGGEIRVRVGWTAGGGQYVAVKDNGPGIPEDEIPVVLSAFGQGSIAIKSAEQGTGLGLPIVQGLIAIHGGEFELTSKLREGTEAIAIFPASRVMEELPALPAYQARAARR